MFASYTARRMAQNRWGMTSRPSLIRYYRPSFSAGCFPSFACQAFLVRLRKLTDGVDKTGFASRLNLRRVCSPEARDLFLKTVLTNHYVII